MPGEQPESLRVATALTWKDRIKGCCERTEHGGKGAGGAGAGDCTRASSSLHCLNCVRADPTVMYS